jgi:hypothetical protein
MKTINIAYIFVYLHYVQAHSDWCVVQSDNRRTDMIKMSVNSAYRNAFKNNYTHLAYDCHGKGSSKPAILLYSCNQCKNIIWLDSDAIITKEFNMAHIKNFISKYPNLNMILGTDFRSTNEIVRKNKIEYTNYFNNGVFYVRCNPDNLLVQWKSYTESGVFKSDQESLQWMTMPSSIFSSEIKYEFEIFGAYSKYINHYPGAYRSKFPLTKTILLAPIKSCPLL